MSVGLTWSVAHSLFSFISFIHIVAHSCFVCLFVCFVGLGFELRALPLKSRHSTP
jgi:hypothetical protein